jgi:hypothetical protein
LIIQNKFQKLRSAKWKSHARVRTLIIFDNFFIKN